MSQYDVGTALGCLNPRPCCVFALGSIWEATGSNPEVILLPITNQSTWNGVLTTERNTLTVIWDSIKNGWVGRSWELEADFFSLLLELTVSLRSFWNNKHKLLGFLQHTNCISDAFCSRFCRGMWTIVLFSWIVYDAVWNFYFYQLGKKDFILEKTRCLPTYFFTVRYFCKFVSLPSRTAQLIQDHSTHAR